MFPGGGGGTAIMLPGPAPSGTVYVIALFSITTSNCDPGTQPLFRFSIHQKNRCVKERKRKVREEEEGKKKVLVNPDPRRNK